MMGDTWWLQVSWNLCSYIDYHIVHLVYKSEDILKYFLHHLEKMIRLKLLKTSVLVLSMQHNS